MSKVTVKATDENTKADVIIPVVGTIEARTPAGQVYISYEESIGMVVVVRGEKASTTVKFNDKAVV